MPTIKCAILILAAGSSSRLGKPKQLLRFNNKTLLQHAIDEAVASETGDVVVVTGANHNDVLPHSSASSVGCIYNEHWREGMGSSIAAGLSALLLTQPGIESVIILLCDQPHVSSLLLTNMMATKHSTGKGIVACAYKETLGVPALFSQRYFDSLLALKGEEGAKKIVASNANDVAVVPFPLGAVDIDTKEDYEDLIR